MADRIRVLDERLASLIAAGEVVDRPASVVKELVENSLDAGASSVSVWLAEGGKRSIRVVDDGCGMSGTDALLAFGRHATSKVRDEEDLGRITTMGFRGEALYSIAAVSTVTLKTRERGAAEGVRVVVRGGERTAFGPDGSPEGTSIEVAELFFNTPGRMKFLRSGETEFARALEVLKAIALAHPDKRFRLVHGSARSFDAAPGALKARAKDLYGIEPSRLIDVAGPFVAGCVSDHELTYPSSRNVHVYVNGRPVRDRTVARAIIDGYGSVIPQSRYPFAVMDLLVPPEDVDVNIHPSKAEVRFKNASFIYDAVKAAVRSALSTRPAFAAAPSASAGWRRPLRPSSSPSAPFASEPRAAFGGTGEEGARAPGYPSTASAPLDFTAGDEEVKNPLFLALSFCGQIWGEFIVAEGDGEFYIIDQHGAAERAAFEALKKEYGGSSSLAGQILLLPERIETTAEGKVALEGALPYLESLGFELAPFGPSLEAGGETFLLKSVPAILSSRRSGALVASLAEELSRAGGGRAVEAAIEEAFMTIACHSVVRGPRPLERREGESLLRRLARVDFSGSCPHGRPVVRRFTRKEVEAFFRR